MWFNGCAYHVGVFHHPRVHVLQKTRCTHGEVSLTCCLLTRPYLLMEVRFKFKTHMSSSAHTATRWAAAQNKPSCCCLPFAATSIGQPVSHVTCRPARWLTEFPVFGFSISFLCFCCCPVVAWMTKAPVSGVPEHGQEFPEQLLTGDHLLTVRPVFPVRVRKQNRSIYSGRKAGLCLLALQTLPPPPRRPL